MGYFLLYQLIFFLAILSTLKQVALAKALLAACRQVSLLDKIFSRDLTQVILRMKKLPAVFFVNSADLHLLNTAALYVRDNESCHHLVVVHILCSTSNPVVPQKLKDCLPILDELYPTLAFDLLLLENELGFTPQIAKFLSHDLDVPMSLMFMGCPGDSFPFCIGEFEGIRTICS